MSSNPSYENPLDLIYNGGPWRIYRITELYNLTYSYNKLHQYALKISKDLSSRLVSGIAKGPKLRYYVIFEEVPTLKYFANDAIPLMITVISMRRNVIQERVYRAIIMSWGVASANLYNPTHLPYLLENGEENVGTIVKSTLETLFYCNITRYKFSAIHLLIFGLNFVIDNYCIESTDTIILSYKNRDSHCKDSHCIDSHCIDSNCIHFHFSYEMKELYLIWNRVKKVIINGPYIQINIEHKLRCLYEILKKEITRVTNFHIDPLDCFKVAVPHAEVTSCGVVNMGTPQLVHSVFCVLNLY